MEGTYSWMVLNAFRAAQQVAQVRGVEVGAARGEGALEARQMADQERLQLQQERQQSLSQLQHQEQQVCHRVFFRATCGQTPRAELPQ